MYTKKVLDNFRKPQNFGKMNNPDGVGKVGNIVCGDVMWLYIKVRKNKNGNDVIKDIKFETFGCVAAIATSSAVTQIAKGKTLDKALKIEKSTIINSLGTLPPIKIHCSVLAVDALNEAIYDYLDKNHMNIPVDLAKKHQKLQIEKEIVDDKYKDWVNE
jgi:nitrogen fixation NifU-like protein